jgi:hypothetical protein
MRPIRKEIFKKLILKPSAKIKTLGFRELVEKLDD